MWKKGALAVETSGGITVISYEIKVFDQGSIYGINGGRISKLWLADDETGLTLASYDRGWDIQPCNEAAESAVAHLLELYPWEK